MSQYILELETKFTLIMFLRAQARIHFPSLASLPRQTVSPQGMLDSI